MVGGAVVATCLLFKCVLDGRKVCDCKYPNADHDLTQINAKLICASQVAKLRLESGMFLIEPITHSVETSIEHLYPPNEPECRDCQH